MNLVELDHALRKLRLSGMADVLDARLRQAQSEHQAPLDLVSALVGDELLRRQDRPSRVGCSRPASATPNARSIPSISTSTRR
jgi:tRNA-dihydrouridine synthase